MTRTQLRVLYRAFLFRTVDLELLSPEGDLSRLLGQLAAVLTSLGILFSITVVGLDSRMPRGSLLISAWSTEHALISATMLVVGLFAVLSWDATFPDRQDVLVLGPLPVRASTLCLARVVASATALSLTVIALNALTSLALTLALAPPSSSLLALVFSPAPYRVFGAYWLTVFASGIFVYCCVLCIQGLAAQVLPRRQFLPASAWLQMAAFSLLISVYFLQPSLTTPAALNAPENQRWLLWLPSYWFLGLFQELNGSAHPCLTPMAKRAWIGMAVAGCTTALVYALSYFRTLRKTIEEPDILPGSVGFRRLPRLGDSLSTAIAHFSFRTLLRSRQHRVMLAFYLGVGFGITILFMNTPRARQQLLMQNMPLLLSSLVLMFVWVTGTRVVFSMPLALRANWIFRLTQVRSAGEYMAAIWRSLFVLAVAPVWLASAVFFLSIWPWWPALGHLAVLGLWGTILAWLSLHGFQKIPFTCSWLPGKSQLHMAFLAALGLLLLIGKGAVFELRALYDGAAYTTMITVLFVVAVIVRWRTVAAAKSGEAIVQFEEVEPPAIFGLGLHRDGVFVTRNEGR